MWCKGRLHIPTAQWVKHQHGPMLAGTLLGSMAKLLCFLPYGLHGLLMSSYH